MEETLKYLKYYIDEGVQTLWEPVSYTIPLSVANVFDIIRHKHKLLLHPISDLLKEITVKGKKVKPYEELFKKHIGWIESNKQLEIKVIPSLSKSIYLNGRWISSNDEHTDTLIIYMNNFEENPHWLIEKLISWHFSMYLI